MELVRIENGQVYADSLMVAMAFGKNHRDVLRAVEILIVNMESLKDVVLVEEEGVRKIAQGYLGQEIQSFFIESSYIHPKNKQNHKMYKMTKNGFALLVMGFTGLRALEWKLRYIEAYDNMEKQINQVRDICISDTKELELIRGSARSIVYLEEKLRSDMKEMEKIIKRIGDHNAHLYSYGTQILDMSKNIEQGKLRDKNEY